MKSIEMDLDQPLHFDDPATSEPVRVRNSWLIDGHVCDDVDTVTAYAHSVRIGKEIIGPAFGSSGGKKAATYSRSVANSLHHSAEYCPCKRLTAEEYEECKCHDI